MQYVGIIVAHSLGWFVLSGVLTVTLGRKNGILKFSSATAMGVASGLFHILLMYLVRKGCV